MTLSVAEAVVRASEPSVRTLFLAWQDLQSRRWYPIGKLWRTEAGFRFAYIRGFDLAVREAGLAPLPAFPDVRKFYDAEHLFPTFRNRVMNASRDDYSTWSARMGFDLAAEDNPEAWTLDILARSQGRRLTDQLELFPLPIVREHGRARYRLEFFTHGLRHTPPTAQAAAEGLGPGEVLHLVADLQNPVDPLAVALRTPNLHFVGYVPRYHCPDLHRLFGDREAVSARVMRVNRPPAPPQQRLLVRVEAAWPFETPPLSGSDYALLSSE